MMIVPVVYAGMMSSVGWTYGALGEKHGRCFFQFSQWIVSRIEIGAKRCFFPSLKFARNIEPQDLQYVCFEV